MIQNRLTAVFLCPTFMREHTMKRLQQLWHSKRVRFMTLLNVGYLAMQIEQLTLLRSAAERLFNGYAWAQHAGLLLVVLASIGIIWTKLYDDAQHANQSTAGNGGQGD